MTASLLRAVERFVLPNACLVCDRPVEAATPDGLTCGVCRSRMRRLTGGCTRCAQPLPPVGPCRFCAAWPDALAVARSAVWLDREARTLVHELKYGGYHALGSEIGRIVARSVQRPFPDAFLVPVPLAAGRRRARGYNQAEALARGVGAWWRLPVTTVALARRRETPTQTALTPEARHRNVADAFAAVPPPGGTGRPVILVDDVLTTGATLCAAARALGTAGWGEIGAVTFARALPYDMRAAG